MFTVSSPAALERLRGNHLAQAGVASSKAIARMHINLAVHHHEQLIRLIVGDAVTVGLEPRN